MEIERKFLLKELPEHLDRYPCHRIEQGYLCTEPVVRIRRQDDDYILTYKSKGLLAREEYNLPLTKEAYDHLAPKTDGLLIQKTRYNLIFSTANSLRSHLPKWNLRVWMRQMPLFRRNGLAKMSPIPPNTTTAL